MLNPYFFRVKKMKLTLPYEGSPLELGIETVHQDLSLIEKDERSSKVSPG